MLAGGYSWRLFFYVEIAFAVALLILAFLFVEESLYHRPKSGDISPDSQMMDGRHEKGHTAGMHEITNVPERRTYLETLRPWRRVKPEGGLFSTMLRSFTYFPVPAVFWVITTYGTSNPRVEVSHV